MSDSVAAKETSLDSLDPRLLKITFQVNDKLRSFDQSFRIRARGSKFANPLQNECRVDISGLDEATRNYILTETSPFNKNRTAKVLTLYAGRVSTGLSMVYQGDITISSIEQPPEVTLILKCGTLHFLRGKVGSQSGGSNQKLSVIASRVAKNLNVNLNNQAKNRTVNNYSHNGNALDEVIKLQDIGVDAYIDDTQLILKEAFLPLEGKVLNLSKDTGMLGVPIITEQGLKVSFLYNPEVKLGGAIRINSHINPAANGLFVIYKLNFALSSREQEFQYLAECLKAVTNEPPATVAPKPGSRTPAQSQSNLTPINPRAGLA